MRFGYSHKIYHSWAIQEIKRSSQFWVMHTDTPLKCSLLLLLLIYFKKPTKTILSLLQTTFNIKNHFKLKPNKKINFHFLDQTLKIQSK